MAEQEKLTIAELEKEYGYIARDRKTYPANKKMTREDFVEATKEENGFLGINHEDRTKFLEDNGYPVTHENMINVELSALPPEE